MRRRRGGVEKSRGGESRAEGRSGRRRQAERGKGKGGRTKDQKQMTAAKCTRGPPISGQAEPEQAHPQFQCSPDTHTRTHTGKGTSQTAVLLPPAPHAWPGSTGWAALSTRRWVGWWCSPECGAGAGGSVCVCVCVGGGMVGDRVGWVVNTSCLHTDATTFPTATQAPVEKPLRLQVVSCSWWVPYMVLQ